MRSAIFKNNHRGLIIAAVAAISMVAGGFALPASATTGVPRLLPLAVAKGALSITAPGSQDAPFKAADGTGTNYLYFLGLSVSDTRNVANSGWVASVSVSKFTNQLAQVATNIKAYISPNNDAVTTGTVNFEYLGATAYAIVPTAASVMKASGINGNSTVSWSVQIEVEIPVSNKPGFYTGKATSSVV